MLALTCPSCDEDMVLDGQAVFTFAALEVHVCTGCGYSETR